MLITVSSNFSFVLDFLGDEEKKLISNLIAALTLVDTSLLKEGYKF